MAVAGAPAGAGPWQDLVPLCRSLRETLTSLHEMSDFTRRVYEAGADVCSRAGDWGEALKCLTLLSETIYPALAAEGSGAAADVVRAAEEGLEGLTLREPAGPSGHRCGDVIAERAGTATSLAGDERLARWPEVASCHVAFFACLDPGGRHGWDTAGTLRSLPPALLATAPVQTALRAHSALAAGHYVQFFRLQATAPPLLRLVLEARGAAERVRGLAVINVAFRTSITAGVVAGMLAVTAAEELERALQRLAGRCGPLAAAAAAASTLQAALATLKHPALLLMQWKQSC